MQILNASPLSQPRFAARRPSIRRPGQLDMSAPGTSLRRPSGRGGKGMAAGFLAFFTLFLGACGAIVKTGHDSYKKGQEIQQKAEKTALAKISMKFQPDAILTADRHILQLGQDLGHFTKDGKAYLADGRYAGHAKANGKFYSSQWFVGTPLGHVTSKGRVRMDYGLLKNTMIDIQNKPGQTDLSKQDKAAIGLLLMTKAINDANKES